MSDNERAIMKASYELFSHYGFRKTTMGEIAKRAGLSRPTLYSHFESKEQIFAAVVDQFIGRLAEEVEKATADVEHLHDKLVIAFELAVLRPFVETNEHAFKKELLALDDPRIMASLERGHETIDAMFTRLVASSDADVKALGMSAPKLGRMLSLSARGLKEGAKDVKELKKMLDGLVELVRHATTREGS